MQIHTASDVLPDGRGLVARQSRFAGALAAVVLGGSLAAVPAFTWYHGAPWFVWLLSGGFALVVVPMLVSDAAARFRNTNWLLWLEPDGLWINLRSYQTAHGTDPPTLARLRYEDLASAGEHVETYDLPGPRKGRTVRHRERSLDLRLKTPGTGEFRAALARERNRPGRGRTYLGGLTATTRAALFPVSAPEDGTIRILWRGGQGHHAAPSLAAVLRELECHGVPTADPTRLDRPRLYALQEPEFDDLVRHLAGSTGGLSAVTLLRDRRGLTTTEARRLVDAFASPQRDTASATPPA